MKWICSDPDCAQYYSKVDDYTFAFFEAREIYGEKFVVCHTIIDLRDYTLDEIWNYCAGYYSSLEEIVQTYGFREALHIMAECVFEQTDFSEKSCLTHESFGKAVKFIHKLMQEN